MSVLFVSLLLSLPALPSQEGWQLFERVRFVEKYFKELNDYYLAPSFDSSIKAHEGKEITLKGHYIPVDMDEPDEIILSKSPYSMCFFCGGAGPETVAEVYFSSKRPKFKSDQMITVKGKLELNSTDVNHMNFILRNATVISE